MVAKGGIMVSQLLILIMTDGRISMFVKVDTEKQKLKKQTCFMSTSMILRLKNRQKNMGLMKKDIHCMLLFLIWIMTMILMSTSLTVPIHFFSDYQKWFPVKETRLTLQGINYTAMIIVSSLKLVKRQESLIIMG